MEARLPEDKLSQIRTQLSTWLGRRKATKREILSLVGLLQHATRVVKPGRTFVSRVYNTAAKIKELHYYTTLTKVLNPTCAGGTSLSTVGMVLASLSVMPNKPPSIVKL